MSEEENGGFAIVPLDVPQGVVCTDGVCTIPDGHPAAGDDGSEDSTPEQ